ncbi:MAG: IS200/IS605 family element transposase accessory protein TnpB [Coriobacteriales bacterium]|jgi:putative transposase|nr:IS200/IS605 family element transposase accessory protein TnpB [Coriobacteriales bacterium]
MLKALRYRIYPNKEQRELLSKAFGCARYIYNWALDTKIKAYTATGKSPSRFDLNVAITSLKKDNPWLGDVSDWVLKTAVDDVEAAYTAFFQKRNRFPRFKSKRSSKQTFRVRGYRVKEGRLCLPKIGKVKCIFSRPLEGELKTCTVTLAPSGKYFVSCLVDDGLDPQPDKTDAGAVGIDLGLKDFATLSTGEKIATPKLLRASERKLARLQRGLARKTKGSNRYKACKRKVARIHEKIANQRTDFLHKLSTRLVNENQVICIEDLNVSGMLKNHHLAKSIADASWSEFVRQLEYKCDWYGSELVRIGRFEPSSKLCSCGSLNSSLTLDQRIWTCPKCGATHDRDILAAQNIVRFAVATTVKGRGENVRLLAGLSNMGISPFSSLVEASIPLL